MRPPGPDATSGDDDQDDGVTAAAVKNSAAYQRLHDGSDPDGVKQAAKTADNATSATTPAKGTSGDDDTSTGNSSSCAGCDKCSFSPTTPVLLADGKTKPIAELVVGDKVESANPSTGKEEGGRTVQHIWINHDTDLLDVTVNIGHGRTAVLHTTSNHPFWDNTTPQMGRRWKAQARRPAQRHWKPTPHRHRHEGQARGRQQMEPHRPAASHVLCTRWHHADPGSQLQCGSGAEIRGDLLMGELPEI